MTILLKTTTRKLACKLTYDELRTKGDELAMTCQEIVNEENNQKQIKDQLKRMTIFGNIHENELSEYYRSLNQLSYTSFVNGITWLIDNYDRHSFPLPVDIIKASKQVALEESQKKTLKWGDCGTVESNAEFWKAWHLVEKLPKERWDYYYAVALGSDTPMIEGNAACEYYIKIQNQIKTEAGLIKDVGVISGSAITEPIIIDNKEDIIETQTSNENLPF